MQTGLEAFIQDMTGLGLETTLEAELVVYRVVAVDGAYAGRPVETGVAIGELASSSRRPTASPLPSLDG